MTARLVPVVGLLATGVLTVACSSTPASSPRRLAPGMVAGAAQDQSYEVPGKPQPVDEEETPSGVGFNQMGGEMNPYASESEAINKVNYHFHFYGAPPSGAPGSNAPSTATAPDGAEVPGPPGPSSPPAGYAPPVWSTPMALGNYGGGGGGWGGGYHFHFYHGGYGMPASQGNATGAGAGVAGGYNQSGTNYDLPSSQGNAAGAGGGYGGGVNYHFHFYGAPAGNPGGFAP